MTEKLVMTAPETTSEAPPVAPEAGKTAPAATPGDRPAWLPEQFKTPEDLAKAFSDTQAELTRSKQELAKGKPAEGEKKPTDDKATPDKKPGDMEITDKQAEDVAKAANADLVPYVEEFNRTGDVAVESRTKIAESLKAVLGEHAEEVVNDYIEARKAQRTNATTALKDLAGGDEGYGAMVAWAKDNIAPEERAAYNRAVNSGDFHAASLAVSGLHAKFQAKAGKAPKLLSGNNSINTAVGFTTMYQLLEAQRDPRYGKDPDYTASVQAKLTKSNF
jgi:hypothetical protein